MFSIIIYITRLILVLSVLINVFLGGKSNQTFSTRNWEWKRAGKFNVVFLIDFLFVFFYALTRGVFYLFGKSFRIKNAKNHCMESWIWWTTHAQEHACENLIDRMNIKDCQIENKLKNFRNMETF